MVLRQGVFQLAIGLLIGLGLALTPATLGGSAVQNILLPGPNITPTQAAFGSIVASTQETYARRIQAMIKVLF